MGVRCEARVLWPARLVSFTVDRFTVRASDGLSAPGRIIGHMGACKPRRRSPWPFDGGVGLVCCLRGFILSLALLRCLCCLFLSVVDCMGTCCCVDFFADIVLQ